MGGAIAWVLATPTSPAIAAVLLVGLLVVGLVVTGLSISGVVDWIRQRFARGEQDPRPSRADRPKERATRTAPLGADGDEAAAPAAVLPARASTKQADPEAARKTVPVPKSVAPRGHGGLRAAPCDHAEPHQRVCVRTQGQRERAPIRRHGDQRDTRDLRHPVAGRELGCRPHGDPVRGRDREGRSAEPRDRPRRRPRAVAGVVYRPNPRPDSGQGARRYRGPERPSEFGDARRRAGARRSGRPAAARASARTSRAIRFWRISHRCPTS